MITHLSNSVIAKYHDLSVSCRSIICLSLRLPQIIDLLAADKSRYFAQPRALNVNCWIEILLSETEKLSGKFLESWSGILTFMSKWLLLVLTFLNSNDWNLFVFKKGKNNTLSNYETDRVITIIKEKKTWKLRNTII